MQLATKKKRKKILVNLISWFKQTMERLEKMKRILKRKKKKETEKEEKR